MDSKNTNEAVFGVVFIILFLPPLVLLIVQIYRSVVFLRNRRAIHNGIWLKFKESSLEKRLNIHLLLKIAFLFINFVRLLQGLLFVGTLVNTSIGLDNAIRFWIPFIVTNILFSCICVLMYYWLELGIASLAQVGKLRVFPKFVTWGVITINFIFHLLTIILLGVYIKPDPATTLLAGTAETNLFQRIYFFVISLPMLILVCVGMIFVRYSITRVSNKASAPQLHSVSRSYRKMGIFSVFVICAFAIRVIMNFLIVFFTFGSDTIQATLVFIWNAIPEIILSFALIGLIWVRKSSLKPVEESQELMAEEIVVPEASFEEDTLMETRAASTG